MNVPKRRLRLHRLERFHVSRRDERVSEVKIHVDVVEIHGRLFAWVGEVCEDGHVGVQEVTHVEIGRVEGGGSNIELWSAGTEEEVDYEDH